MNEQVRQVLERVAEGAWSQTDCGTHVVSDCAFCYREAGQGHDENCPVTQAQQLLQEQTERSET